MSRLWNVLQDEVGRVTSATPPCIEATAEESRVKIHHVVFFNEVECELFVRLGPLGRCLVAVQVRHAEGALAVQSMRLIRCWRAGSTRKGHEPRCCEYQLAAHDKGAYGKPGTRD